jgi:ATP adenylyltransferase
MTYDELKDFLQVHMRMSHVYQPLMIRELLTVGGKASTRQIAADILARDESQIEYYEAIVKNMVGRVLTKRTVVTKSGKDFELNGYDSLTPEQRAELVTICDEKVVAYEAKRGEAIWSHRSKSAGYISGTLRFEVLKKASFHCELCGISADQKALEVDHIVPRNHGGTDDPDNLQALCFSCNAMKRDRDSTDFRAVRESYCHNDKTCIFCNLPEGRVVAENRLAIAIRDAFPVTPMHSLVIRRWRASTLA